MIFCRYRTTLQERRFPCLGRSSDGPFPAFPILCALPPAGCCSGRLSKFALAIPRELLQKARLYDVCRIPKDDP